MPTAQGSDREDNNYKAPLEDSPKVSEQKPSPNNDNDFDFAFGDNSMNDIFNNNKVPDFNNDNANDINENKVAFDKNSDSREKNHFESPTNIFETRDADEVINKRFSNSHEEDLSEEEENELLLKHDMIRKFVELSESRALGFRKTIRQIRV